MSRNPGALARMRVLSVATVLALAWVSFLWGAAAPPAAAATSIMGPSVVTASELAGWFASTGRQPHPDLGVSIATLAGYFIAEGRAEGVRGDIAFAQSIVETGYFSFPDSGQVRPSHNNYGGIGAVDGGNNPSQFPTPQIGVRAQIQHLRAYADRTVTENNLAHPLVDPRFHLVTKGSAPNWDDLGGGKWASDPDYGTKILAIFARIHDWADLVRTAIPLTGDWNGDGRATPGWFKDGLVLLRNSNSNGGSDIVFRYGRTGDVPVTGDWNADGRDTIGVRRGATWYLTNRNARGAPAAIFNYGWPDDLPVTGDWNRNGQTTVGVRRGATWYLTNRNARGAPAKIFNYGRANDVPVTGDWDRNRTDTIGVVRGTVWYLRNINGRGTPHYVFNYQG
jgi:hypothetical protein